MQHLVAVKVWGQYGCFTRPEFKVERVSYPLLTPSAAVGILEAIYWKPQFRWQVTEIRVMPHPDKPNETRFENYMPITLNEVAAPGERHPPEYIGEQHRIQRTCLVLRWPCYVILARAQIFYDTTNPGAIKRQFDDRVENGQCFHQPYMGLRQFTAYFGPPNPQEKPLEVQGNFGRLVHSAVLPEGNAQVRYRFVDCAMTAEQPGRWVIPRVGGDR